MSESPARRSPRRSAPTAARAPRVAFEHRLGRGTLSPAAQLRREHALAEAAARLDRADLDLGQRPDEPPARNMKDFRPDP